MKGRGWYCVVDQQVIIEVITYPDHRGNTPEVIGIRDVEMDDGRGIGPTMFRPRRLVKDTREEALKAALPDLRDYIDECDHEIVSIQKRRADARALLLSAQA